MAEKRHESTPAAITPDQIEQIQALARTIRYGSITLVFQDGLLIQIDRSEKIRIQGQGAAAGHR